jgi:tetratricopeptide (TPR) repeat protein
VPIDRDDTLKRAEKLLRQGNLDAAIAEYVRLTAEQPQDWSSVNALGDLYVRAGQRQRAIAQFARVGDHLARGGDRAKAAAVYRKILRLDPDDPRGVRGLSALTETAPPRAARSAPPPDVPADPDAKVKAAHAAQDAEDIHRACELLIEAADMYTAMRRPADAIAAVAEASTVDPANPEFRHRLIRMLIEQGEIVQARYVARVAGELLMVADAYEQQGRHAEALDIKAEAAAFDSNNLGLRHRVLSEFAASGEVDRARRLAQTASELMVVAEALARDNRVAEVIDVIGEALQRAPSNAALRKQFVDACLAVGDLDKARRAARTTSELIALADALEARGDAVAARQVRADALRREPADPSLRGRLIHDYAQAGDMEQVRWLLTPQTAGDDPALLRLLARVEFVAGRLEEGREALTRLLGVGGRRDDLVSLSTELADAGQLDAAFSCAELLADTAVLVGDWDGAAAGLDAFTARVPHHVPALMKLVDICVDGGLNGRMAAVQARLADDYVAAGRGPEARIIAEDLVLRAPWDRAHVERCRRALALSGDSRPDRTIADLLCADGPFSLEGL